MPSTSPPQLLDRVAPSLAPELKSYIVRHRTDIEALIRAGGQDAGLSAARRNSKVLDGVLCSLFAAVEGLMRSQNGWMEISLAAVGSYGRETIALHSDLDVRLLCAKRPKKAQAIGEALLYPLWDAGLNIGHQIVAWPDMLDLAKTDLATATTLLDWRHIAGDPSLTEKMLARAFDGIFGPSSIQGFLDRLTARTEERHERYGDSVYLLEPDVKHGAGGLRDLDIIHWVARARWRVRELSDLVKHGVLVPRQYQAIDDAARQLWRIRNLLHLHAGRRSDRLSFDRQEQLAMDLGYGEGGPAVERFMSDYYVHARTLERSRELILARAEPPPRSRPREISLGQGLKLTNDQVSIEDPAELERDPTLALRVYQEALKRGAKVYAFARDQIVRALSSPEFAERLRDNEEAARIFRRLVTIVHGTELRGGSVLKELHDVGLLVAMIPEFAPVVGRVHHDIYHVFTVDVHSVEAVDKLRALCRGECATDHPLASRLAAELPDRKVLFFATLLHDVGKDIGGKNHAERGALLAQTILARFQFTQTEIEEVQLLIRKHLRMYQDATRRDIDDPHTLEMFAGEVRGQEALRNLYLLTVADVSTTSPQAMTAWKSRMLEDLYVATKLYIEQGPEGLRGTDRAGSIRRQVLELCPAQGEQAFLQHYLSSMPDRYLYGNDPDEIVRQSRFARQAEQRHFSVEAIRADEPYLELGIIADDRPGLLAMMTATLAASRLKVVSAQIYSYQDGYGRTRALDLFWVRSGVSTSSARAALPRLERDFDRLLSGEISPAELVMGPEGRLRTSERPAPKVATEINFDNRAASHHTVIEIITQDQSGLLFWLSNCLQRQGLTISLAKINTEGNQVADVFYVQDGAGEKVTDPTRLQMLKDQLISTIANLEGAKAP